MRHPGLCVVIWITEPIILKVQKPSSSEINRSPKSIRLKEGYLNLAGLTSAINILD